MIKNLLFSNPTFNDGINLTVRKGHKWHCERQAHLDLGGKMSVFLPIMHTRLAVFDELTDADLVHEHDPICRTKEGLFGVLQEVYPGFLETDEVTLIHFILNFRAPLVGDNVYTFDDFGAPYRCGEIEDVIPLNDHFYEIHSSNLRRTIVHASQYRTRVLDYQDTPSPGWMSHY